MGNRKPFTEETRRKTLLWSDRHCCLCGKACGTDIEVAHVDRRDDNDFDNAIPLCYDCHAEIGRYNEEHPRGSKYKPPELKARREQIYERYTRHLVPPLNIELGPVYNENDDPDKPRVQTSVTHRSDSNPVGLKIVMRAFVEKEFKGVIKSRWYSGETIWNMTPRLNVTGNFRIEREWKESDERLRIEVNYAIIDVYEREHHQLPFCFAYVKNTNSWNYEPASFEEISKTF